MRFPRLTLALLLAATLSACASGPEQPDPFASPDATSSAAPGEATVPRAGTTATPPPTPTSEGSPPERPSPASPLQGAGAPSPGPVLELGMADAPGGASELAAEGIAALRYQYLSGGVGTDNGWPHWGDGAAFVREYVRESLAAGLTPVFSYYMVVQALPDEIPEGDRALRVLATEPLVDAYFRDLELFFAAAGEFDRPVVLHLEPDLWAFAQQRHGDDARSTPVAMAGVSERLGTPVSDDLAGFAQATIALRDRHAPNVRVAYHLSHWAGGDDFVRADSDHAEVEEFARRTAAFFASLGASFDLTFTDLGDRDSAFRQDVYGQGDDAWWTLDDFERHRIFVDGYHRATAQEVVLWQIPYGNTVMRAQDNSWNHYQDNRVEVLLDDPERRLLRGYAEAGVVALLFGRGADGATDASDAAGDGVTNPAPINGNERPSLSADDDGGFFRDRAAHYYRDPLALPRQRCLTRQLHSR